MAISNGNAVRLLESPDAKVTQPNWFAEYRPANHKKRVAEQLARRSVEHSLPLYQTVRRRKGRRVKLTVPLFPGYVFVHLSVRDRLKNLQIPGVSRLVGFDGTPTPLPEDEILALRTGFASGIREEPHPYLTVGQRVQILSRSFQRQQGVISRSKKRAPVAISIDLIARATSIEIDPVNLQQLAPPPTSGKIGMADRKQKSAHTSRPEKPRG